MKKNKLLVLGVLASIALTSCGQKEITSSEAKEIAKNASEFKTSEFNFLKVSTTITKYDVTSGNATIYKELINKITPIEIGKVNTTTYEYKEVYLDYVVTKEAIEALETSGATNIKYYANGNKLSVSSSMSQEQTFGNLTFKIATSATNNYNENGYLTNAEATIDITFSDSSTCSQAINTSVEWVK